MAMRLGFIGLGNMGSRLASKLTQDAGNMMVWDRNKDARARHTPAGAEQAGTIPELAESSDIMFYSVTDDAAARDVVSQLLQADLSGKVVVDFSTISPNTSAELAGAVKAKGGQMLDAAVSGTTALVDNREITLFVGGEREAFERVRPLLEPLAKATHYIGENGSGLKVKLCANALLGIGVAALAEALTLGQKLGLSKDTLAQALSGSAVLSPSQASKMELAKKDDYSNIAFALDLMHKDLGLILDEAIAHNTSLPLTESAHQLSSIGVNQGLRSDFAVMVRVAENLAGLK